jgi:hypothetical protein
MTLSALGIFSAAGAGGASGGAYELISSTILGTATTTVDFTGLDTYSTTYKHLQIRFTAKNSGTTTQVLRVQFNGVTTGSYAIHALWGDGTSVNSGNSTTTSNMALDWGMAPSTTTGVFSSGIIDILDTYSTTKNKTIKSLNGYVSNTPHAIVLTSGFLNATSAISSIRLFSNTGNLVVGSRFSIYGIKG